VEKANETAGDRTIETINRKDTNNFFNFNLLEIVFINVLVEISTVRFFSYTFLNIILSPPYCRYVLNSSVCEWYVPSKRFKNISHISFDLSERKIMNALLRSLQT